MNYVLTKEQIQEIRDEYCDDLEAIITIQKALAGFDLDIDQDDYFELFVDVAFQYESVKNIVAVELSQRIPPVDAESIDIHPLVEEYKPVDQMIVYELENKYGANLESCLSYDSYQKVKTIKGK